MSVLYDFRLIGADRPDGEIDVEDAIQILGKLQEVATRVGRLAVDSAHRGRPSTRVERIARLRLTAVAPGSTTLQVTRASSGSTLNFDLVEEQDFDKKFSALVAGIATNRRPADVNESVASSVADLVVAIRRAAPRLEIKIDGRSWGETSTEALEQGVWRAEARQSEDLTVEGRLEKVDIRSGDFRVRDAIGIGYPLPKVKSAEEASQLIGRRVRVTGLAERNSRGEVVAIRSASVIAAPDHLGRAEIKPALPLEALFEGKRSLGIGDPQQLSVEEQGSFLEAMGL